MSYVEKEFIESITKPIESLIHTMVNKAVDQALDNYKGEWWTYEQAAEYLGISVSKLKKLRAESAIIPYCPSPGIVRFNKQMCDDWIKGGAK